MSTYGYFKHDEMSGYAISHHGIKGQKWGIRRFQNPDGSLTSEGMRRYGVYSQHKQIANKFDSMTSKMSKNKALLKDKAFMDEYKKAGADWENELKKYKDKDYRKSIKTGKKMERAGINDSRYKAQVQNENTIKKMNNLMTKNSDLDKKRKEVKDENARAAQRGNELAKKSGFDMSKAAKNIADSLSNYRSEQKVFSWENAEEELLMNYKGYINMGTDDRSDLMSSLIDQLEKKGYELID